MAIKRIWAVNDTEKIKKDDITNPLATDPNNLVWQKGVVYLLGVRNEIVSFQLILEGDSAGQSGVNVTMSPLVYGSNSIANTSNDPTQYVGRNIEIFLEHYINVKGRSNWTAPYAGGIGTTGAEPLPDSKYTGWIPDLLVPIEAPSGQKANGQGGAPFSVPANMNQGVWFDIYIPKTAPSGVYSGTVTVTGMPPISINLSVYDPVLPDQNHLKTFFHFGDTPILRNPSVTGSYTSQYWSVLQQYMSFLHRHRVNPVHSPLSVDKMDNLKGFLTGTAYTPANGYDGPGVSTGEGLYSIGTYDMGNTNGIQPGYASGFAPLTQAAFQSAADSWETWFQKNAPNVLRFKYLVDEPPRDRTMNQSIKDWKNWISSSTGPGKSLKTFCTVWFDPDLVGANAVDIYSTGGPCGLYWGYHWSPTATPPYPTAQQIQATGRMTGIYNSYVPCYGELEDLDNPLTSARSIPWVCWKYNVDFYFLWETTFYTDMNVDPWATLTNITNPPDAGGGGTMLVVGNDKTYPTDARFNGPIASMRLKTFRRGMQDYELLWLLKQSGKSISVVDSVVPHAVDDFTGTFTDSNRPPTWPADGQTFDNYRSQVIKMISTTTPSNTPSSTQTYAQGYADGFAAGVASVPTPTPGTTDLSPVLNAVATLGSKMDAGGTLLNTISTKIDDVETKMLKAGSVITVTTV